MENTKDIRNKEIRLKVKETEDTDEVIKRYMKRHGFEHELWARAGGLLHYNRWYKDGIGYVTVGSRTFNDTTNQIVFEIVSA